jgi:hypothetical protein
MINWSRPSSGVETRDWSRAESSGVSAWRVRQERAASNIYLTEYV